MKKIILGLTAGIAIFVAFFVIIYKIGEDMVSMHRCGCNYKLSC